MTKKKKKKKKPFMLDEEGGEGMGGEEAKEVEMKEVEPEAGDDKELDLDDDDGRKKGKHEKSNALTENSHLCESVNIFLQECYNKHFICLPVCVVL